MIFLSSNWEKRFKDYILERGYDYYCSEMIEHFGVCNNTISAVVNGTEDYEVEIELKNNLPENMNCTCPYAEDGNNCKHMAAVLFKWDDEFKNSAKNNQDENIEEIVNNADEQTVRKFLYDIISNDEIMRLRFLNTVNKNTNKTTLLEYKKLVDSTIDEHCGYEGYIDYYGASDFIDDLIEFKEDIEILIQKGKYTDAFELSYYICSQAEKVEMDDSDGGLSYLFDEYTYLWNIIIEKADNDSKDILFNKMSVLMEADSSEYLYEYVESIFYSNFREDKYLSTKLQYIQNKIDKLKRSDDTWTSSYRIESLVTKKLDLMLENNSSFDEIKSYCMDNWKYSEVRKWLCNKYISDKNYESATTIYIESIDIDKDFPGLVREYRNQLKKLYKLTNKIDEFKQQLWLLVTKDDCNNLEQYRELKNLYSVTEWETVREKVFENMPKQYNFAALYNEEKLYDRLLKVVLDGSMHYLTEYDKTLAKLYPNEILDKYEVEINKLAQTTASKKEYKNWVKILKRIRQFKGGKEKVNKIVSQWKVIYKNRHALMDELKNL